MWPSSQIRTCIFAAFAYAALLAADGWAFGSFSTQKGSATVLESDCRMVKAVSTVIHLVMNILSTLLLGASTLTMQNLCAPTRREVDKAHSNRQRLDIGIQSFRNIWFMGSWRLLLWALLACSATMIHLTYNSVFFVSAQSNQYAAVLTSKATLAGTIAKFDCNQTSPDRFDWLGTTRYNTEVFANKTGCPTADLLSEALLDTSAFIPLSPRQCAQQYGEGLVADTGSVILVSAEDTLQSIGWAQWPQRTLLAGKTNSYANAWVCHDRIKNDTTRRCSRKLAEQQFDLGAWTVDGHTVDHCFAKPVSNTCKLKFNAWLMLEVCVFVTVMVVSIFTTAIAYRGVDSLRTVGDAIASFLGAPDSTTNDMCMADSADFGVFERTGMKPAGRKSSRVSVRWYQTLSTSRWYGTHFLNLGYTVLMGIALYFAYVGARGAALANGPGNADIQSLGSVTSGESGSLNLIPTILVVNIPQLGYTLVHMCNNGLLTRMLLNSEWRRFATERKGLRISGTAKGEQRDTHFFSMPYRFAVPFMAYSSAVYWLLSQSIFLVQIESLDVHGEVVVSDSMTRFGYSCQAIIVSIGVLALGQGFLLWLGSWKLRPIGMPSSDCHSLAISAACHPPADEVDAQFEKIQWGEILGEVAESWHPLYSHQVGHCAFSSQRTVPPAEDRTYI